MRPIRVKVWHPDWTECRGIWVGCDSGRAVVIRDDGLRVFQIPYEALEVLEDVSEPEPEDLAQAVTGEGKERQIRKRRRKRAPAPRGPRANQWIPPKSE